MMLWYTPGPASLQLAKEILQAGATGARLTFSFSTAKYQEDLAHTLHELGARLGVPVQCVADLAGEKFRLGSFAQETSWEVVAGDRARLTVGDISSPQREGRLTVTDSNFFRWLSKGDVITIGDGNATLLVEFVDASACRAEVCVTAKGVINQNRGVTLEGRHFQPRCLTRKDYSDLAYITESADFDVVLLSFVATAEDVKAARRILASSRRSVALVAKIETRRGLENAESIAREADALMAARGDLALAIPWTELPEAVDRIAATATEVGKPWILATQVAEGMERFTMPTRAEICDLAHWARRGASGVLLSYETAFGARPVEAVVAVRKLADRWAAIKGVPGH